MKFLILPFVIVKSSKRHIMVHYDKRRVSLKDLPVKPNVLTSLTEHASFHTAMYFGNASSSPLTKQSNE